jgi:hypothetical protein
LLRKTWCRAVLLFVVVSCCFHVTGVIL